VPAGIDLVQEVPLRRPELRVQMGEAPDVPRSGVCLLFQLERPEWREYSVSTATAVKLTRTLYVLALVCSALVLGLTLAHVLQSPGTRSLSGAEWLDVQHTFYGGFAVVGGAAEILGLLAATALGVQLLRRRGRVGFAPLLTAVSLFGTLLVYWFGNRPVNALIVGWTAPTLPADWAVYRDTWENAHAISAGLAALGFAALLLLLWSPVTGASRGRAIPGPPGR